MTKVFACAVAAMLATSPALADPCDDLISTVQGALATEGQSPEMRSQLEGLLNMGASAKAKGDVAACQAALTGSLQTPHSPMPAGKGGGGCSSTSEKTV